MSSLGFFPVRNLMVAAAILWMGEISSFVGARQSISYVTTYRVVLPVSNYQHRINAWVFSSIVLFGIIRHFSYTMISSSN